MTASGAWSASMVGHFGKGVMDEVAIRADLEARAMPVTTANLTMAMERLRAASPAARPAGSPPTVAQIAAAENVVAGSVAD